MILGRYVPSSWIYSSMRHEDTAFLDSSMNNDLGRRSYIGLLPYRIIDEGDPVDILNSMSTDDTLIGYISYDHALKVRGIPVDDGPESGFSLADFDIIIEDDPAARTLDVRCRGRVMDAEDELRIVESLIDDATEPVMMKAKGYDVVYDVPREDFIDAVKRAKGSMYRGDYYVINLTRRMDIASDSDPFDVFLRLRGRSPSPYGAYLDIGGVQVISSSMELLLEMDSDMARTHPIKGTSPRTGDPDEDDASLRALLSSEKDRSELLMVSDMERNDMNRFCIPGTVNVVSFYHPEEYATVFHTVAVIEGRVRPDIGIGDAFDCMFPGGSVTGAPKEVCIEAIDELESRHRGIYTGSIGMFSKEHSVINIVIRTLVHRGGIYSLGIGSGITFESDPESEYYETVQKAKAVLESLRGGIHGLRRRLFFRYRRIRDDVGHRRQMHHDG